MARLDNVSLGIKKSVFDAYEFLPDYAEDLDLGIRLIKDGHALLFQSSNAVIHSHNRPAFYFFKRSYADTVALWDILRIERGDLPAGSVMEALNYVYSAFKMSIFSSRRENWSTQRPSDAVNDLIRRISHNIKRGDPILHLLEGDRQVDEFFRNIRPFNHKKMANEMNRELQNILESFSDFTEKYVAVCDIEQDFLNSMYKLFCITAGHYLAVNSMEYVRALKGSV